MNESGQMPPRVNEALPAGTIFKLLPTTLRGWAILVSIAGAILLLPWLGHQDIVSADEGQRAYPPQEMLQTGDWLVPRLNGEEYLKKPPLLYWHIAAAYRLFGKNEFTARLSSALSGIALAVLVLFWAAEFCALPTAALAALVSLGNGIVII